MTTRKKGTTVPKAINNGAATATPLRKVKQDTKTPETEKKQGEAKTPKLAVPTASARIERMRKMNVVAERFEFLKEKDKELFTFMQTSDGSSDSIILSNGRGERFEVNNTAVIEATVKLMRDTLDGKIKATEKELETFEV